MLLKAQTAFYEMRETNISFNSIKLKHAYYALNAQAKRSDVLLLDHRLALTKADLEVA